MPNWRRRALLGAAGGALAAPHLARAQGVAGWPNKPVTILVPYGPGGTTDIVARIAADHLKAAFGQPFVVENRAGASGTIAMAAVARSAPDGHTLLANDIAQTVVSALIAKLPIDPIQDLVPATMIAETPVVLAVANKVEARTLPEFIALAKRRPGEMNYGSGGTGSGPHLAMEFFKSLTGTEITHVPYRGSGAAVTDLVAGNIDALSSAGPTIAPHAANGSMRALVVSGKQRIPQLPNVPTAAEAGLPDFIFSLWFGLAAPRGTPRPILDALHREVVAMASKPEIRERLTGAGADPSATGPDAFSQRIKEENQRWTALIQRAGIKPE
ncbi:Bug family tripartite tricarboxylate transporter substrate binding protein [Roseomonas chloroacetimidivorans]|uniref:Bug family tripartite tricarboxylate transporter substrate binding protein n=1 Tax=Roseomonas chloroacetimidivorans TaxID=1766656 RepID=UPI003C76EC3D